jgi:hypothetical protein
LFGCHASIQSYVLTLLLLPQLRDDAESDDNPLTLISLALLAESTMADVVVSSLELGGTSLSMSSRSQNFSQAIDAQARERDLPVPVGLSSIMTGARLIVGLLISTAASLQPSSTLTC